MPDPSIEPESGLSYKILYERLFVAHLELLRRLRLLLDEQGRLSGNP